MFGPKNEPLASSSTFRNRVFQFFLLAFVITMVWLVVGGVAFHLTADLSWQDSFYNSAMMVDLQSVPYYELQLFPPNSLRPCMPSPPGWSMSEVSLALPLHPSSIAFSTCFIWTIPATSFAIAFCLRSGSG